MANPGFERRVEAVRRFNRFYTKQIGLLREHLLDGPFSLTEGRVLYELAHRERATASELGRELALDAGYLSRMLRDFRRRGLIVRRRSDTDGRQSLLSLTDKGQEAFATLNAASRHAVGALLTGLPAAGQERLVKAMRAVQTLLGAGPARRAPYILRPHRPGDMGWVVHRHGVLYWQEHRWDGRFEALVAELAATFVQRFDPERERCWIAEKDGENVGCVFCVRRSKTVAQLRLLLVEPAARGLGIGKRLVDECLAFARAAGYRKIMLWTNDVLHAARHIYERTGFRLVEEERHTSFGRDLVGQTWEREL
jgi:DNA-binding MarR family transcriptional regulator/N-acetylglutamate synthase-like GNAT family acetyltransferase